MSTGPLSLAFFDPARRLHGVARAGATLLFEDGAAGGAEEGPVLTPSGEGWRAVLNGRLDLQLDRTAEPAEAGGARSWACRVTGSVGGSEVSCLGAVTETISPPDWSDLDALREIAVVAGESHALFLLATRPRGVMGHGVEDVQAVLIEEGRALPVEEARLSTVYGPDGRQQSAGLELWLEEEDFPRRASGVAVAGSTIELPGLVVNAGIFDWQLEGQPAAGLYEITSRQEEPTAA